MLLCNKRSILNVLRFCSYRNISHLYDFFIQLQHKQLSLSLSRLCLYDVILSSNVSPRDDITSSKLWGTKKRVNRYVFDQNSSSGCPVFRCLCCSDLSGHPAVWGRVLHRCLVSVGGLLSRSLHLGLPLSRQRSNTNLKRGDKRFF